MNLYYIQIDAFNISILFIIFLTIKNRSSVLPASRVAFNKLLAIIAIVCVSDVFAWCCAGNSGEITRSVLYVSNTVYYTSVTWAGYAWLTYVEIRIKRNDSNLRNRQLISAVPLFIMLLLLITNPLTKLIFSIDDANNYARGKWVFLHWIISGSYLLYAMMEVLITIRKTKSRIERRLIIPMLWFIVPTSIAACFQMLVYGSTAIQCGMTLSAMIIAFTYLVEEGSTDSMTGLNNRRFFETELTDKLQNSAANLTVLMCDIDNFKMINDTLGHISGDLILKRMAEALRRACALESHRIILCRYGGDEFVICGFDMESHDINGLIIRIEDFVKSLNKEYGNELEFDISVGDASGICDTYDDVEALIGIADSKMYLKKQNKQ